MVLAGLSVVTGCSRAPAEQRLRETIAAMEAAVESADSAGFLRGVAEDFSGNNGAYDRRQLHATLRALFLRHRDIGVVLGPLDIVMHGEERAQVTVNAVLTGGSGGLLPDSGRRLRIDSGWRQDDGEWRCISATWQ